VAGSFGVTFDIDSIPLTSKGGWDGFVAKLDAATGNGLWAKQFGSTADELIDAVAVDPTGGIFVVGRYAGYVNFGGSVLPIGAPSGDNNVFVMKLDGNGKHVWSNGFGDAEPVQFVSGLAVDNKGAVLFTGEFEGTMNFGGGNLTSPPAARDIYLAKLSSSGMHEWSQKFGASGDDRWPRVAVGSTGDVFLSCYFSSSINFGGSNLSSDGSFDIAVARFMSDGSHVWSRRFGGPPGDMSQQTNGDIAWSPGAIFVTGSQIGVADYGKGPLTSAGNFDAVVVAIGP
jgi:hypothetical protein